MNKQNKIYRIAAALLMLATQTCVAKEATSRLAEALITEGSYNDAALEYRRLALYGDDTESGGYAWMSAYAYNKAGNLDISEKMLNLADASGVTMTTPILLLSAENAEARGKNEEAEFYLQAIRENPETDDDARLYAARKSAVLLMELKHAGRAEIILKSASGNNDVGIAALRQYRAGSDKKPLLGGAFGIIPGLGYAYSGEYANALRSLLLNSLFIFGMINTAENDQWGAFAVITFFEITWYSGSIYGGVDAAHRYNRRRLENCKNEITGQTVYHPNLTTLPLISLQFEF